MSNALIVRPMAPASVTASVTGAGDVAHVALAPAADYMGLYWRCSGTAGVITADMGADVTIDTVALINVLGAGSGQFVVDVATAAQGTGFLPGQYAAGAQVDVHAGSEALTNGRQAGLYLHSATAPLVGRYVRLTFSGLTADAFQFSRLVIGRRFVPERNFSFGVAAGVRSFGSVAYSDRAVLLRRQGNRLRVVGLTFPHVMRDEVDTAVAPLVELAADDVPVLLVTDPAPHAMRTRCIYFGHFEGDLGTVWRNAKAWEWRANLVSLF